MKRHLIIAFSLVFVVVAWVSHADSGRTRNALETAREAILTLSTFGQKRVGTPEGARAGDWIAEKMRSFGLQNVHFESFSFPKQEIPHSSLSAVIEGKPRLFDHLPLVRSAGTHGPLTADAIDCGSAHAADLAKVEVLGKIAIVRRDPSYDRSQQLRNVADAGAVAMVYISDAPRGEIQTGSVIKTFEISSRIPTVSVNQTDGDILVANAKARTLGKITVDLQSEVSPISAPGTGRNVVARIEGLDSSRQIVFGAHYDTHFVGAVDNESGVAVLLALAERLLSQKEQPRYTLVFVAYDGEEIALYGGYDYLRRHYYQGHETILAAINLEMPVGMNPNLAGEFPDWAGRGSWGISYSDVPVMKQVFENARVRSLYSNLYPLAEMAKSNDGLVSTDIQGHYRIGIPTATTDIGIPFYHTPLDTLDNLDVPALAESVDAFERVEAELQKHSPDEYSVRGAELWQAEVTLGKRSNENQPLDVEAVFRDGDGEPQPGAVVTVEAHVRDFFPVWDREDLHTDGDGRVRFQIPAKALAVWPDHRFLHITAGKAYPQVETIVPLE